MTELQFSLWLVGFVLRVLAQIARLALDRLRQSGRLPAFHASEATCMSPSKAM